MNEQLASDYEKFAQLLREKKVDQLFVRYTYDGDESITDPDEQVKWNALVPSMLEFMRTHELNQTTFLFTLAQMLASPDEAIQAVLRHDAQQEEIQQIFNPRNKE